VIATRGSSVPTGWPHGSGGAGWAPCSSARTAPDGRSQSRSSSGARASTPPAHASAGASGDASGGHLGERPPDVKDKVFDDEFSDETSGWKTATAPTWDASYRDRKYELHVLPTTTHTIVDAPVDDVPDSQLMEVKVASNKDGGEAGVFCRGRSGFAFLLRADGVARIARLGSGQVRGGLAVGQATDLDDGDNRIQAACVERGGSTIDLAMWVNGERVVSSASTPVGDGESGPSGLLVVRSENATGRPRAVFDDFALCSV